MENQVVVSDYSQMDRVLKEERSYILNIVKQIKKAGCNVLLIQKSILRWVEERRAVSSKVQKIVPSLIDWLIYGGFRPFRQLRPYSGQPKSYNESIHTHFWKLCPISGL